MEQVIKALTIISVVFIICWGISLAWGVFSHNSKLSLIIQIISISVFFVIHLLKLLINVYFNLNYGLQIYLMTLSIIGIMLSSYDLTKNNLKR